MGGWGIVGVVAGVVSALLAVLTWLGITPETAGETLYSAVCSAVPFVMLASGFVVGWSARGIAGRRKASAGAAGNTGPAAKASSDPFAYLTPKEVAFLLQVYDESAVYVGENYEMVEKLNDKGLVFRIGCSGRTGQIIQQCDVVLADELVPIIKEREEELRKAAAGR